MWAVRKAVRRCGQLEEHQSEGGEPEGEGKEVWGIGYRGGREGKGRKGGGGFGCNMYITRAFGCSMHITRACGCSMCNIRG